MSKFSPTGSEVISLYQTTAKLLGFFNPNPLSGLGVTEPAASFHSDIHRAGIYDTAFVWRIVCIQIQGRQKASVGLWGTVCKAVHAGMNSNIG